MSQERTILGDEDGFFPGRVVRVGPVVDWKDLRDLSFEKERAGQVEKRKSMTTHGVVSSKSLESSTTSKDRPGSYSSTMSNGGDEILLDASKTAESPVRRTRSLTISPVVTTAEKLDSLLAEPVLNLDAMKKLAWAGLPNIARAAVWKILLGYLPTNSARRKDTLERRRREYREAVEQHYDSSNEPPQETTAQTQGSHTYSRVGHQDDITMRQISVDLPRTCPGQALFHIPEVRLALQRILYVWATRHPASGYVQGMNDLVTPFMFVFLSEFAKKGTERSILTMTDMSVFENPQKALANAEADAYWCLTALLNDIQDYYTFSQPGIQRRVHYLRELVARVDSNLCTHLEDEGLDFLQFAFRWMNCLLMRELPFPLIVRVWDTYLAESDGFALFHVYVCAALLVSFSEELQEMDFQDLVMFLQNLPTESWTSKDIDVIISQAYMWRTIFGAAPSHLQ